MKKSTKHPINCRLCGKYIPEPARAQIYCEKCGKWINKNNHRTYREANVTPKDQKPKNNKPSLSDIMHEATKEGLQYVAYCKKHGLY